jgi:hypothetical protein
VDNSLSFLVVTAKRQRMSTGIGQRMERGGRN